MYKKVIRKCVVCGKYTLKLKHCKRETISAHPIDFKPFYKYIEYRIKVRFPWIVLHGKKDLIKEG